MQHVSILILKMYKIRCENKWYWEVSLNNIIYNVPQSSILGPILSNNFVNDQFLFVKDAKLVNFAHNNEIYLKKWNILFGIALDNKLKFQKQIAETVCRKASKQLNAISII